MTDYSDTFKDLHFTTHHDLSQDQTAPVISALEAEIADNLVYDHWHPEIAGPLQLAVHFLQTRGTRK